MTIKPKIAPNGKVYLNLGCGSHFHADWNNLDIIKNKNVLYLDVKKGLPFEDGSIDFAYSSHLLEHLTRNEGEKLLNEAMRVLGPGGILRIAVPDLENISREYLRVLNEARENPSDKNLFRLKWMRLELFDQMIRKSSGGEMRQVLNGKVPDREYLIGRIGDAGLDKKAQSESGKFKKLAKKMISAINSKDPEKTGELHKYMYDGVELGRLAREVGFQIIGIKTFDKSNIQDWGKYNLDASALFKDKARKPDSLYFEVKK